MVFFNAHMMVQKKLGPTNQPKIPESDREESTLTCRQKHREVGGSTNSARKKERESPFTLR